MFKPGDKVKHKGDFYPIDKNKVYIVKGYFGLSSIELVGHLGQYTDSEFELVKEEDKREPKQGEMVEARCNDWHDGLYEQRRFIAKYLGIYVCHHEKEDAYYRYDKIRPIQQKETLQSVFDELKEKIEIYSMGYPQPWMKDIGDIVKRMDPFINPL